MEPATMLFSRVLDSCGSQLPLIRLHEEIELVSGSWLLFTSVTHSAIQHKPDKSIHTFLYLLTYLLHGAGYYLKR